ncbi:MAG TPA: lysophospholipid acyltransferase family protein [Anaerolineaceae bacterium]|nr:lysophospholipid acyltransferase family protein [Anaerolineaceae bacterium]
MIIKKTLFWFSKPVVSTYTGTMLQMEVRKHAQIPEGAKIIAANHPSTTDPFFVAAMLRKQCFILIKDVLFQVPVFGEYLRRLGHIPVRAGKGQEAIDAALAYLRAGQTIMIFPEGDLSPWNGGFHQAKTGVARIALASGAPVIPVGIHLVRERILPLRSTVRGQVEDSRWYLAGPYHMTVGTALRYTGDVEDRPHVRAVSDNVMHHIIELARESENRLNRAPGALAGALQAS